MSKKISNFKFQISKWLGRAAAYQPLIEARIFKDAILHNLAEYQKAYPKLEFAPVLKSNAYGHGLVEVAKILDEANCTLSVPRMHSGHLPQGGRRGQTTPFFMVDSFYEALVLRRQRIKTKILILGYNRQNEIVNNKLKNVSFGVIDLEQLKSVISNLKSTQDFHLKIDTGMHRQGILLSEIEEAMKLIKQNKNFVLEGLCTHFADADGQRPDFTNQQIEKWNTLVKKFKSGFPEIKYFHASNTAGAVFAQNIDANVGRLGLGLYGIDFSDQTADKSARYSMGLKPALEMISVISSIKKLSVGEKVGYGITFTAQKPTIVATVPVGYNEGVDRRLSNKGYFRVAEVFCPIVGRVSMNMSSIDVSAVIPEILNASEKLSGIQNKALSLEKEVIIISKNPSDKNSVENIAKICECIPWEILVHIPQHLRRTVL